MARQGRQKKSTVSNLVAAAASATKEISAPEKLNEAEDVVFQGVVASRERDTWSEHDLRQAVKLAKLEVRYSLEWDTLIGEGLVLVNERGTQIENPRNRVYNTLLNGINQISSKLGLTASQRGVAGNKQAGRNDQQTQAKMAIDTDDDLIPKANTH